MSKIHDFSGGMSSHPRCIEVLKVKLLRLFITISFTKDEKDNISQLHDCNAPFCEAQYTHGSLFKFKSFDQFNPPERPQILDIYSVVVL